MKKILKYMHGFEIECIMGPFFKLLEATFELFIPLVVAKIIDSGIASGSSPYILKMCGIMIALGIIGLICAVTAQYFAARAAVNFSARLRHAVLEHLLELSYSQIDKLGSATMITRMTSDINQIQNGVNLTLRLLLRSPFVVFGAMIMAFTINVKAALVFVGVIPVLCVIVFGIMLVTMPMYRRVQAALDKITSATRQNLSGVRVLRAFCKEESEISSFNEMTGELSEKQLSAGRISALLNPITFVVINFGIILLIQIGAVKVQTGILTQGLVIALYNYMSQILVELIKMANLIITMTKAAASANRVASVLDIASDQPVGNKDGGKIKGSVTFEGVTVRYNDSGAPALSDISFFAEAGKTIGIIGGTGSGKTTLINLIPGLYLPSAGSILIDGIPVQEYDVQTLRHSIGIVPQKAVLFKGTIRENLCWAKPNASDDELWRALDFAQAREIVKSKEGELEAVVEQGGINFSGGQRQRLTIARALVGDPRILILDDSASALDYATDASLRKAIREMKAAPTTFIVSQRAASVRFADEILVLDDGKLVGKGTHESLLEECDVYQEIYYSQFPKEVTDSGR